MGYEGQYAITSCGRVWSYKRKKFLKPSKTKLGYLQVSLSCGGDVEQCLIHRLVADNYLLNPEDKPQVNHKDEDKTNNNVNNLEWATASENINHGTRNDRMAKSNSIPIYCVELDRRFDGAAAASRELGLTRSSITACCRGRQKTTGGYHWQYA